MSEHKAILRWQRASDDFTYEQYSRDHEIVFGTGASLRASAAAAFHGNAALPNPEELLVGAIASCHMLTFLAIAAKRKLVVDSYEDHAVGELGKGPDAKLCVTHVVLRPRITFSGDTPSAETISRMHEASHRECFIARSVNTKITVESD